MAYRIGWLLSIVRLLLQTLRTDEFLDQDGHDYIVNPAAQLFRNGLGFTILLTGLTDFDFAARHLLIRVFGVSFQFGQQEVHAFLQGIAGPQLLFIPENDSCFKAKPPDLLLQCVYFLQTGLHPQ
jgi:hypothetical protein